MFTILSISDSDKHFSSAIQEYTKRLGNQITIENLRPFRDENQLLVIEKESEKLIELLHKKYSKYQKILLIKEGKLWETEKLAETIQAKDTVFIIWWPYGVDEKKLKAEFWGLIFLSFGAITLPHGLAKLTLIEQLYRCTTLWSGKKYHY